LKETELELSEIVLFGILWHLRVIVVIYLLQLTSGCGSGTVEHNGNSPGGGGGGGTSGGGGPGGGGSGGGGPGGGGGGLCGGGGGGGSCGLAAWFAFLDFYMLDK